MHRIPFTGNPGLPESPQEDLDGLHPHPGIGLGNAFIQSRNGPLPSAEAGQVQVIIDPVQVEDGSGVHVDDHQLAALCGDVQPSEQLGFGHVDLSPLRSRSIGIEPGAVPGLRTVPVTTPVVAASARPLNPGCFPPTLTSKNPGSTTLSHFASMRESCRGVRVKVTVRVSPGSQEDPLYTLEGPDGNGGGSLDVGEVELDHLLAGHFPRVLGLRPRDGHPPRPAPRPATARPPYAKVV